MTRAVGSEVSESISTTYSRFEARLPRPNQTLAPRLVGYYEYSRALALLDQLLALATAEELKIIEEMVQERDEFVVHTNLSQHLETAPTSLSEPVVASYAQRGLGWVMALARVELGAILAGFTDVPEPFRVVNPSRYEAPQYFEILLDSTRTHYLALEKDPMARLYASYAQQVLTVQDRTEGRREINEPQAIAYGRRVLLASEFAAAVRELFAANLTPQQHAQLASMQENLQELRSTILYKVLGLGETASYSQTSRRSQREFDGRWQACPRLISAMRREARGGSVQVETRVYE